MYDTFWADWYLPAAMPALEKLFFSFIPAQSRVLDLCCGSGHVTKELVRRGYNVTGVDNSAGLIELARSKLPGVDFRVQDAEQLNVDCPFQAALCTFDSINHILSLEGVQRVFTRVFSHLNAGGRFVFDMNLEQAYFLDLRQWQVMLNDRAVSLVRGRYDPLIRKAETELIWFSRQGDAELWTRRMSVVEQRCHHQEEIVAALRRAGFTSVETVMSLQAGMQPEMAVGRIFFIAVR